MLIGGGDRCLRAGARQLNSSEWQALCDGYRSVGVARGGIAYVTGNFGRPGSFGTDSPRAALPLHLSAIRAVLGDDGTLVVPTHSWSLRDSGAPFDVANTSSETGPFTELVRSQSGSQRQFHAFASVAAVGPRAHEICASSSRHAYGPGSPWDVMCSENAVFVSVAQPVSETISAVHHAEFLAGVPYRYTREFTHPCQFADGSIRSELFYLQVLFSGVKFERDRNQRFLAAYDEKHGSLVAPLGRAQVQSVELGQFMRAVLPMLHGDLYSWLRQAPSDRPWTNWL